MPFNLRRLSKKKLLAVALTGGAASAAIGSAIGFTAPVMSVLSNLFSSWGTELINELSEDVDANMQANLMDDHYPAIRNLAISAMQETLLKLPQLYQNETSEHNLNKAQLTVLRQLATELPSFTTIAAEHINEIMPEVVEQNKRGKKSNPVMTETTSQLVIQLRTSGLPDSFCDFFSQHFASLSRYYFAAGITKNSNSAAKTELDILLARQTLDSINMLLHRKDKLSPTQRRATQVLVSSPSFSRKLSKELEKAFTLHTEQLYTQYQHMHRDLLWIGNDVKVIGNTLLKTVAFALGALLFCVIIVTLVLTRVQQSPFNSTIRISKANGLSVSAYYPPLVPHAGVALYLDKQNDLPLNLDSQVVFANIPHEWLGKKVRIVLHEKNWHFTQDSIILRDEPLTVTIEPNGRLTRVEARFVSSFSGQPVSGLQVHLEEANITVLTDKDGRFRTDLPISKQMVQHTLDLTYGGVLFPSQILNLDSDVPTFNLPLSK